MARIDWGRDRIPVPTMTVSMWLYCTLLLWAGVGTSKVDSIEVVPRSRFVAPRGKTTLTCFQSVGKVEWLLGPLGNLTMIGNNISDTRFVLADDTYQLNITDYDQLGDYYCRDTATDVLSCPATISLAEISSDFKVQPSDVESEEGEDAIIFCQPPVSYPPALVGWTKDGRVLSLDSSHVIGPCGLVILNVSVQDAGSYQCVALNSITMEQKYSQMVYLNVTAKVQNESGLGTPSIVVAPSSTVVMEGDSVTLQCVAGGCPVSWAGPYGTLPPSAKLTPGGVLTLENIGPSEGGQYNCTSVCGTFVSSAIATVLVKVLPKVTIQPNTMFLMIPEGNTVSCTVSATGHVQLYWLQSGRLLATKKQSVDSNLTLLYPVTTPGFYQCMAISSQGCDHAEVYILVTSPTVTTPQVPTVPATLASPTILPLDVSIKPSSNVTIMYGDSVELVCTAVGGLSPSVTWIDTTNASSSPPVVNGSSDVLTNTVWASIVVGDSGRYGCFAIDKDTSSSIIFVTVTLQVPSITVAVQSIEGEEGSVMNVSCAVSGCRSAKMTWSKGLLALPSITQSDTATLTLGPLSVLDAGTYTCSVECSSGFKADNQVIVKVTTLHPPPQPPSHVTAMWINGSSIQITWDAPPHPAYLSPILGYKLNWAEGNDPLSHSGVASVASNVHSFSIATITMVSSYTVAVWAYSKGGDGPMRVATLQPLIKEPYLITSCDTISSDSADILWKAYAPVSTDSRLVYACDLAQVTQSVGVATPGATHLTQLLPNCSYTVWLHVNGKDQSNCSFSTPPGPLNIKATTLNGVVQLHWTLPEHAKVELFIGDQWVDATQGGVIESLGNLYEVAVKVTIGSWTSTSVILLPKDTFSYQPSISPSIIVTATAADADITKQVGLLYGVIFGGLLVACVTALSLILALKYIQMSRMKQDKEKGIKEQRKQQTEAFRRMSLTRSSSSSLGKTPPPPYTTRLHDGEPATIGQPTTCIGYHADTSSRHSTITNGSLKLTPPPGNCSDLSSGTSDDTGSVGAITYTIVTTRRQRRDVIVTDI